MAAKKRRINIYLYKVLRIIGTLTNTAAPAAPQEQQAAPAVASTPSQGNSAQRAEAEILDSMGIETDETGDDASDLEGELTSKEKKAVEKFKKKLKVGGKEIEVDEDELVRRAQMGYSADEKWQEAAKMRKQMETFVTMLQEDPAAALEKMGFNVDEMAERRIQQRIEEMKKSPEQVEKEKIERELKQLKAEREQEKEVRRQSEIKQLQDRYAVELESEINTALESNQLPKSPYIVKRMADVMIYAMKNKIPNFSAKKALEIVESEVREELNKMYEVAPDEVFEKLVGKDRLNKYRKSKVTKKAAPKVAQQVQQTGAMELRKAQDDAKASEQKIKMRDFFKTLGKK